MDRFFLRCRTALDLARAHHPSASRLIELLRHGATDAPEQVRRPRVVSSFVRGASFNDRSNPFHPNDRHAA